MPLSAILRRRSSGRAADFGATNGLWDFSFNFNLEAFSVFREGFFINLIIELRFEGSAAISHSVSAAAISPGECSSVANVYICQQLYNFFTRKFVKNKYYIKYR